MEELKTKQYDFDRLVERRGTGALKTDALKKVFGKDGLLPMWVADMDFETPPFIVEALRQRLEHPVFGYTIEPFEYWPVVKNWIWEHHGWEVETEWLTYIPGIVKGIAMAINALLAADEKVVIQPPVYHPFRLVPQGNNREIVYNPLICNADGSYSMDFDQLAEVYDPKCKMLILSNPHNPAGIVWDRETLQKLASFCHERGIVVISDEIHCDMALFGNKHIPFASVSEEAASCSITFGSPSKTFNIAGIVSSYAIVPDKSLRDRFFGYLKANEYNHAPIFSPIATIAAFTQGEEWRQQLVHYLEGNVELVEDFCRTTLPGIKVIRPQASFLVWLDCRGLSVPDKARTEGGALSCEGERGCKTLNHDELIDLFVNKAGLALNDGAMFGKEGSGFMRMNIGCPRSTIQEALNRLATAVNG